MTPLTTIRLENTAEKGTDTSSGSCRNCMYLLVRTGEVEFKETTVEHPRFNEIDERQTLTSKIGIGCSGIF